METAFSVALFGAISLATVLLERRKTGRDDGPKAERYKLVRHLSISSKWSEYSDDLESFVRSFPKVELHIHLDGSFDPDVLWQFLQENRQESLQRLPISTTPPWDPQTSLPIRSRVEACQTSRDFHSLCTCRGYRSLNEMLNRFQVFLPLVQGNLALIEHLAFDFCQRQRQQNVVYTEVRYSPHLLAESIDGGATPTTGSSISAADVVLAVTRGLRRGCAQYKGTIVINQILCAIGWRPEWASSTLDLAIAHRDQYPCAVVGVDIAAGEEHFNKDAHPELYGPHIAMAQRAHETQVPLALHAGEIPDEEAMEHVRRAVVEYKAKRIGHGYRMTKNPEIMELVRQKGVHVEICPTSSVETGGWLNTEETRQWDQHPASTMMNAGLSASFSSDDPAVFHTSLSWQYRIALAKMKIAPNYLIKLNLDAVDAAFCDDGVKEQLRERLETFAKQGLTQPNESSSPVDSCESHSAFRDRVYLTESLYI